MNFLGAAASRVLCSSSRILWTCPAIDNSVSKLPIRPYSTSSTPFRRKTSTPCSILTACGNNFFRKTAGRESFEVVRTYASARIVSSFENLPVNYKDGEGLSFRKAPLSKEEAVAIFGKGMDTRMANRALKILHGRRVAGTLADPALAWPTGPGWDERANNNALSWLRSTIPVDEEDAAGQRAQLELSAMEEEAMADGERMGLYKSKSSEPRPDRKETSSGIYGESALDSIRDLKKESSLREELAKERERKRNAEETKQKTGPLKARNTNSSVELQEEKELHPRLQYYLERSKVLPEVPPEMSGWQRIWPTGLLTIAVIGLSSAWAYFYIPPTTAHRLWPDVPPAAATILVLMAANLVVFLAWRVPPAFRVLNLHFVNVPGYPRPMAALGNTFSHQTVSHFSVNMLILWFLGSRLHDDIGRAKFMAVYLSTGVFASFVSLIIFTFRRHFVTSSLGASGSLCGITAAFLWLHKEDHFKVFGFPPAPLPGVSGIGFLVPLVLLDVYHMRRPGKAGHIVDNYAHLGGYAAGLVGGEILARNTKQRRRLELGNRNSMIRGRTKPPS